jgi:transcriptional regulator with XRE-family HTH domain
MPPRTNTIGDARRHANWLLSDLGRELRLARHSSGATMHQVGTRVGWSKSKVSRIERGLSTRITLRDVVLVAAVVGLRPSLRFYPTLRPLRDVRQIDLLAGLSRRMHASWTHRHEVPMPNAGDLRAADQVSTIPGCRLMVEAYVRLADYQAQVRSARQKQRDLGADRLLILVADTQANRRAVQAVGAELRHSFPVAVRPMLAALAAGVDPGGDGLILLRSGSPVAPRDTKGTRTPSQATLVAPRATRST